MQDKGVDKNIEEPWEATINDNVHWLKVSLAVVRIVADENHKPW